MHAKIYVTLHQLDAKWVSLIFFIILNSALMIALRYCTIYSDPSTPYISSTAVLFSEIIKLLVSLALSLKFDANGDLRSLVSVLNRGFIEEKNDCLRVAIPAVLYTIQNNLQYVIETAPLFQMLYHIKLLSSAIFYTTLLSQRLTVREWMAIIALMIGVSMVQSSEADVQQHHATLLVGVESVVMACLISGLAGVYFEKILKSSKSSIWLVNIQLSLMCTGMALLTCWYEGFRDLEESGSFVRGYNKYVIIVILLQSFTGLSVALVVKYSDNIFKGFATSISVALSCIIGSYLFDDVKLNDTFCRGSLVVFLSSSAYVLVTNHRYHQNVNMRNGNVLGLDPNDYHNMQLISTLSTENIAQISPFTV